MSSFIKGKMRGIEVYKLSLKAEKIVKLGRGEKNWDSRS